MAGVVWVMQQQGWPEEGTDVYPTHVAVLSFIRAMVNITFSIFAAVLMARMIVGEYANKTISLLFVYPIDRRKLLLSKLTLISLVTLAVLVVSNLFVSVVFFGLNVRYDFVREPLTSELLSDQAVEMLVQAVLTTASCWIPLVLGMLRKSATTMIVSAFVIEFAVYATNNGPTFTTIPAVKITLAAIGATGAKKRRQEKFGLLAFELPEITLVVIQHNALVVRHAGVGRFVHLARWDQNKIAGLDRIGTVLDKVETLSPEKIGPDPFFASSKTVRET